MSHEYAIEKNQQYEYRKLVLLHYPSSLYEWLLDLRAGIMLAVDSVFDEDQLQLDLDKLSRFF